VLLPALGLSSCIHIKRPLDIDLQETKVGTKTGASHWQAVLGLVAWGDGGVHAAARNGGLSVIYHADEEILAILFFVYFRNKTIVYGE